MSRGLLRGQHCYSQHPTLAGDQVRYIYHVHAHTHTLNITLQTAYLLQPMHSLLPLPSTCSPVPAGGEASTTFTISPKNALESVRSLTVTFESNQLEGVMGHTQVKVVA